MNSKKRLTPRRFTNVLGALLRDCDPLAGVSQLNTHTIDEEGNRNFTRSPFEKKID